MCRVLEYDAEKEQYDHGDYQQRPNNSEYDPHGEGNRFEEQRQQQQNANRKQQPNHFPHLL
jgi:hypothetical protein